MKIIVPLLISPLSLPDEKFWQRRKGEVTEHDWYRILVRAARLLNESGPDAVILVVSNVSFGGVREADVYVDALQKMHVPTERIRIIPEGFETVTQVKAALDSYEIQAVDMVFISTGVHALRISQLTQSSAIHTSVEIVSGYSRPIEVITNLVLWFLLPHIERFGYKESYLEWMEQRRAAGVL